jgi:uncharacterized membrane protein
MAPARPLMKRRVSRTAVSGLVGLFVGVGVAAASNWAFAGPIAWMVAAGVFLAWTWAQVTGMNAADTEAHAMTEDPGRQSTDVIIIAASVASLGGVVFLLSQAGAGNRPLTAAIGLTSVGAAWIVVHTLFMLRYARLYYTPPHGGIDFNQDEPPAYRDFAYIAFTLGMTYQVSDTALRNSTIRATVLRHTLLSYVLGAVVLAATINLVVGLGTG